MAVAFMRARLSIVPGGAPGTTPEDELAPRALALTDRCAEAR
jgi:hypothetical protein